MSLLRLLSGRPPEQRVITSVPWDVAKVVGGTTKSGVAVTERLAMSLDTVWSCVGLLADTVAALPVDVYRRRPDGSRQELRPPPLIASPSLKGLTAREWRYQAMVALSVWGNAVGARLEVRADRATAVDWFAPESVTISERNALSEPTYQVSGQPIRPEDVVHLRRYLRAGSAIGLAPLDLHQETMGLAIATRDYAAQWFGQSGHPTGILTNPGDINEEQAKLVKRRWLDALRSRREPGVLGGQWKYESIQESPVDSDLADQSDDQRLAVCRMFRIPPEMVGLAASGSSVTYANREQRAIDFLTFTVRPWLSVFEDWWDSQLPGGQFARFNVAALLRTDLITRYRAHDVAIRAGFRSVNEVRQLEDEERVPGGDELLWPPYASSVTATAGGRVVEEEPA